MEVENNEDSFLEESADTDDSQTETQTKPKSAKKEPAKAQPVGSRSRHVGKSATIRITPIPFEFTESDLCEWIQSLTGKTPSMISIRYLKSCKRENKILSAKRDSFIVFDSIADASFCLPKIDGQTIPNADVSCRCNATQPTQQKNAALSGTTTWMIMSGLSNSTTEQDILSHIQQNSGIANKPKTIRLVQHENEKLAGRAFVECANPEDATKCVESLQLTTICGSKIWCSYRYVKAAFNRKTELADKTSLILLANLHYSLESEDVSALCEKYGEVKEVKIWFDSAGYRKGMASVTMDSNEAATKAYLGLHGEKVKNLALITSYFAPKKSSPWNKRNSLKKKIIKSKNIKKKLQSDDNTDIKMKKKTGKRKKEGRSGPKIA